LETGRCREAWLAPLLALLFACAGCGSKQNALDPHSKAARGIESLWWNMLAGAALGLALVAGILLAAYVRRNRPGVPGARDADRVGWSVVLGLGLVVPILVLSSLFLFSNIFLLRDTSLPTASAAPSEQPKLTVNVIGHQFWWEIRYPGTNAVTANELHIPAATPVQVTVHSVDVIHSFWVPQLNRKIDAIPDQVNRLLLYADRPGRYRGQCAEYCGLQHAHMGMYVFADTPQQFRAWLARESRPAARESALFDDKCGSCHMVRGTPASGNTGPDLTHVASRTSLAAVTIPNSRERLLQWIRHPQQVKPGNPMPTVQLTDAQVARIVAYLESLR
jgi:cytochrome c oxidase subunit 2